MSKPAEEKLIPLLKSQVIPCWERFGLERLAVTRKTLKQFKAQSLPAAMRVSVKKRTGQRATTRSLRGFNNTNSFLAYWPEDTQAVFQFPTLAFIVEGHADSHIADYCVRCPSGHFLLFGDGIPRPTGERPHLEGENLTQRHCTVLWFFAPPGTNSVIAYLCYSQGEKHWGDDYHILPCPAAIHLFKISLQELQEESRYYQSIATSSFQAFLRLFLRELEEGRHHQAGKSSAAGFGPANSSPIEQAQQYVKTHLDKSLTTASVAREVFMSCNSLMKHFKEETGETLHEFITRERIEEAHRLLGEGHWSHSFICQFIGLKPTQFRIQFKKHFGMTPSAFRQRSGKNLKNR